MQRLAGVAFMVVALACGTNVDLGGTADGGDAGDARAASDVGATCVTFAAPTTRASCSGCSRGSDACQPNGCFNGYFCDTSGQPDCKAPGTPCKAGDKTDARQ
jgi:hypothetical protein